MNANVLVIERSNHGCALLALNRPKALNALSADLRSALADAVRMLSADDSVRAVVLAGQGRAFCAGLDLKELGASGVPDTGGIDDPVRALTDCPKPVIGVIHGPAITGGFELALACDVLLASPEARFADTHARIGVLPGWGLSQRLARIVGRSRARELAFTGRSIDGATAERWGLVSRVVPLPELRPQALALAKEMASVDPTILRAYKRLLNDGEALSLREALELESQRSRAWAATQSTSELEQRRQMLQGKRRTRDE